MAVKSAVVRQHQAMIVLVVGEAAVGVLLAVATSAQVLAGVVAQPGKEGTGMTKILRVVSSSMMVTVSSVFTSIATAGSHPLPRTG